MMKKNRHGGYVGPAFVANLALTLVLVAIVCLVARGSLWLWDNTGIFEAVLLFVAFTLFLLAMSVQIFMEKQAKKAAEKEIDRIIQAVSDGKLLSDEDAAKLKNGFTAKFTGPHVVHRTDDKTFRGHDS